MLLGTTVKVAFKGLLANKLRSFLAMLGIIIGIAAVIAMLALAAGAKAQIMNRIASMGTNLLSIRPGQHGVRGIASGERRNLTIEDAKAILAESPSVSRVSPVVDSAAQIKFFNKNTRTEVTGGAVTYPAIRNYEIEHGRLFTEMEVDRMAKVAVLGPATAENLGITPDQIGETVKIRGINFQVIGILKAKGGSGHFTPDDQILVPFSTAMKILFGLNHLRSIDVQTVSDAEVDSAEEEITRVLRKRHRLAPEAEDDFNIFNQAEMIETASEFSRTFTFLLGGIAAISLLVGGIGIMNIMLVTVTERTREIGIRKAIGAKDRDILRQFLIESLIMTGVGGLIGVATGIGAAKLFNVFTTFSTQVEPASVLLALIFSAGVGIFFGYYPARRAALLDPIESLHYE